MDTCLLLGIERAVASSDIGEAMGIMVTTEDRKPEGEWSREEIGHAERQ